MDFKDWRKTADKPSTGKEQTPTRKYNGRHFYSYVNEQIRDAQDRGAFDNLPGFGKPLNLGDESFAGDKAQRYHMLKSNEYAQFEIETEKEIRKEGQRMHRKR